MSDEPRESISGKLVLREPELRHGMKVGLRDLFLPAATMPVWDRANYGQGLDGAMFALDLVTHEGHHVGGSAFLVFPGVALTAIHTIDDWRARGLMAEGAEFSLLALSVRHGQIRVWEVQSITGHSDLSDVAILTLIPRFEVTDDMEYAIFRMTCRIPAVGQRVGFLGHTPVDGAECFGFDEGTMNADINLALWQASGVVSDLYIPNGPMFRSPGFGVEADNLGAMSGGPVFDERGFVVGLLTSGLPGSDGFNTTFCSLVSPALYWKVTSLFPPRMFPESTSLISIGVDDWWRVQPDQVGMLQYLGGDAPI